MDVVEWAITQLGIAEDPPRSNAGPPLKLYALKSEGPAAWCGRFVRTGFEQAGTPLPGNRWLIPRVEDLQEALAAVGAWIPIAAARAFVEDGVGAPDSMPRRGDLILLNEHGTRDTGSVGHHVGIVERYESGVIHSIDGNWGNKVQRVLRKLSQPDLWGLGRWPLDAQR